MASQRRPRSASASIKHSVHVFVQGALCCEWFEHGQGGRWLALFDELGSEQRCYSGMGFAELFPMLICPIGVAVLGEQRAGPQIERLSQRGDFAAAAGGGGGLLELIDIDGEVADRAEL